MAVYFKKTIFAALAAKMEQCPMDGLPEVVMSGRSNVGKSTLINTLSGQNKLARTSQTPGKTRFVIYFKVDNRLYLTDLPGYGYAYVSKQTQADYSVLVDQYLTIDRPIAMVLHLMDVRHDPSKEDQIMVDWLENSGLPWRVVLTKCDKLSRQQLNKQVDHLMKHPCLRTAGQPLLFSSSSRMGMMEIREAIAACIGDTPAVGE